MEFTVTSYGTSNSRVLQTLTYRQLDRYFFATQRSLCLGVWLTKYMTVDQPQQSWFVDMLLSKIVLILVLRIMKTFTLTRTTQNCQAIVKISKEFDLTFSLEKHFLNVTWVKTFFSFNYHMKRKFKKWRWKWSGNGNFRFNMVARFLGPIGPSSTSKDQQKYYCSQTHP